ncbi:MAG: hypothetical protein ACPMAQ_03645 [Phycisphaerae bacterium]
MSGRSRIAGRPWLAVLALAAGGGCAMPPGGAGTRAADPTLNPNIIKVIPFYGQNPFGTVGGGGKTNGFVIQALYLVAPTEKGEEGVFGDGIIHVSMFVIESDGEGHPQRRLVREWLFDPEQARPYRTKKRYVGGYGYQLHCAWGDADVLGKRIEIEVSFERRDGQVVRSRPRPFVVPRT